MCKICDEEIESLTRAILNTVEAHQPGGHGKGNYRPGLVTAALTEVTCCVLEDKGILPELRMNIEAGVLASLFSPPEGALHS